MISSSDGRMISSSDGRMISSSDGRMISSSDGRGGILPGRGGGRGGTLKIPQIYKVTILRELLTYT